MARESRCPGCRLQMPLCDEPPYTGKYHCSDQCWGVFAEVMGYQFGHAVVFSHAHQLTVDSYAVQHAGGRHPDKSVAVHLFGLYAAIDLGVPQMQIPKMLQQMAARVHDWPHFTPPKTTGPMTIFDVAIGGSPAEHIERARRWAGFVWDAWQEHHKSLIALVQAEQLV